MATVPAWFNVDWYLTSKAGKDLPKDDGTQKTAEDVRVELANAGYVEAEGIYQHYLDWGKSESVEPFDPKTFDADTYLAAKAANDNDGKTAEDLAAELEAAGLTPIEHFMLYGEAEGTPYVLGDSAAAGDVSEEAAALDAYLAADKALDDALEAAEYETLADAEDDVTTAAGTADSAPADANYDGTGVNGYLSIAAGGTVTASSTAEYDSAVIAETRTEMAEDVAAAEKAANNADLVAAVDAIPAAEAAYNEAIAAAADAEEAWFGAVAAFNKANGTATATATNSGLATAVGTLKVNATTPATDTDAGLYTAGTIDLTDASTMKGAQKTLVEDGSAAPLIQTNEKTGAPELAAAYKDADRADELLAAFNAFLAEINTMADARANLEDSIAEALVAEGKLTFDAGNTAVAALTNGEVVDLAGTTVTPATLHFETDGTAYLGDGTKFYAADLTIEIDATGAASIKEITVNSAKALDALPTTATLTDVAAQPVVSDYTVVLADEAIEVGDASDSDGVTEVDEIAVLATTNAANPQTESLYATKSALADFDAAVEEFNTAKTEYQELADLQKAVDDAKAAITDPVEDGGLGLKLLDEGKNFSSNDDLYVVTDASEGLSLKNFGAKGEDKIFFGSEYSFVALEGDIEDNVGDANALEVFYKQDGKNVTVYVEEVAAAGNVVSTEDLLEVTLQGVQVEDIAFADGFMVAGEATA